MLGSGALGQVPLGAAPGAAPANPPPFSGFGRGAIAATIVALWQPPDPQPFIGGWQPLQPRKLNPSISAVPENPPPFSQRGGSQGRQLATWWSQPDPWVFGFDGGSQPYGGKRMSSGIPGQSADPPPIFNPSQRVPQRVIVAIAQPDPWTYNFAGSSQPFAPRRLSPGIPGQSIDLPPFVHPARTKAAIAAAAAASQPPVLVYPESYAFAGIRQPTMGRQLAPGIPGQSVDNPPIVTPSLRIPQRTIVAIAQPDPWTYTFAGSWQPYGPKRISTGIPGQSIDNPPFVARRKIAELGAIITTWEPPPPQPWFPRYQVKFVASFSQLIVIG